MFTRNDPNNLSKAFRVMPKDKDHMMAIVQPHCVAKQLLRLCCLSTVMISLFGGCYSTGTPTFNPSGSLATSALSPSQPASLGNVEGNAGQPSANRATNHEMLASTDRAASSTGLGQFDVYASSQSSSSQSVSPSRNERFQLPQSIEPAGLSFDEMVANGLAISRPHQTLVPLTSPNPSQLPQPLIRAQSGDDWNVSRSGYSAGPQRVNDATQDRPGNSSVAQVGYQEVIPGADNRVQVPSYAGEGPLLPGNTEPFNRGPFGNPGFVPGEPVDEFGLPQNFADVDVFVQEAQSGRFMIGAGFNSDAGVTGQLIIDERNFDITRPPTSFEEIVDGRAFRGAGQGFRLEAMPGSEVQRYLVSFSEPYLPYTQVSLNVSGYYYDRNFFDWDEQRLGGRLAFGYRLTHDLSITAATRMEQVKVFNPRTAASPELNSVLGDNDLFVGQLVLTHDTRDHPFAPTEGHLVELSYSQAFGTFDYPRGDIDYRRYFLVRERPDGSGRHTLAFSTQVGVSGAQTPVFENYFAGGVSSLRGFDFRGAGPVSGGVRVGGQFRWINTVEYLFPITADDMIKGVVFCDFGTVESDVRLDADSFRVAPGFGVRVNIPNFGGAPLAFDLAFPVNRADTDEIRNFSFFMGLLR